MLPQRGARPALCATWAGVSRALSLHYHLATATGIMTDRNKLNAHVEITAWPWTRQCFLSEARPNRPGRNRSVRGFWRLPTDLARGSQTPSSSPCWQH
uniref:Putative secreted protein n=1 Tax=Ixodes ricinus TaxID=34613 RepID=A0A6B0UI31_IXORI